MKSKTNISIISNTGVRRKAEIIIGDSGTYTSGDILDANAVEQLINDKSGAAVIGNIGDKIIVDDSGLYQVKDGKIYPLSHPDLSTQPSVLPQRYGNLEIKEVLIANGRENEIPANATVLEAFSFNKDVCVPATVKRVQSIDAQLTEGIDYVEIAGIKWATKNVGAERPEEIGLYFQWGDTKGYTADQVGRGAGQKAFDLYDDKWFEHDTYTNTKYDVSFGKSVLELEDDAVAANWGGSWRMPTEEERAKLYTAVNTTWVTNYNGSGIDGIMCVDKEDSKKVLFYPAAGVCDAGKINSQNHDCVYWTSSLNIDDSSCAYIIGRSGSFQYLQRQSNVRWAGCPVRGILNSSAQWQISNSEGIVPDFTLIRYVCQDKGGNNNTYDTQKDYE